MLGTEWGGAWFVTDARAPTVVVIEPRPAWRPLELAEVWRYRDLLYMLSAREIQVRYKQTILGAAWAILQPLMTTGIFAVLFALLMGKGNEPTVPGVPYVVSTFCAMLPWQLFSSSLTQSSGSLVANARLLTKVYFPRLVLPLAAVLSALADFAVGLVALLLLMLALGVGFSVKVLALPVFVLVVLCAALAAGLTLSALSAMYRDFRYLVPVIVQVGLFASPVVYTSASLKLPAWAEAVYSLNPMVGAIEGFRWALLGGALPTLWPSITATIVLLIVGAFSFRRMEREFADVI